MIGPGETQKNAFRGGWAVTLLSSQSLANDPEGITFRDDIKLVFSRSGDGLAFVYDPREGPGADDAIAWLWVRHGKVGFGGVVPIYGMADHQHKRIEFGLYSQKENSV